MISMEMQANLRIAAGARKLWRSGIRQNSDNNQPTTIHELLT
jgi:hypothetical protein